MIAGADLALRSVDVDEVLAFVRGDIESRYVSGAADLASRLQALDAGVDPDGRFRVGEFFCFDNTWRPALRSLVERARVVLMDLRGFGKENRGCETELAMLLGEVPLARVLLIVDRTTRAEELKAVLRSMWDKLPASSPNRDVTQPVLYLIQIEDTGKALRPLLSRLFAAAA